ncbi:diaminopimelate aminotransferase [Pontibacillus halophilus JSM 076056 = DSM 19796]|uniref:Diaminopimelate aminotransferase n=1 Tax=Pontibacillus halophilus JSM 076056 = DSM 19796 TaxID=1385510 RepID=A0A0A5GFI7_9BACI|nr:pyridoxal phosphate-dependent aminotransferase [Pontibacillus halophilus]KGX91976.1 diaminopimelate aminotransferase [Pontibacillus halophilus JSM 076056 = DSM 19796]
MKEFQPSSKVRRLPEQFFARLEKQAKDLHATTESVINLGQGNPDQPTPEHIVEALQKGAEDPINHKYAPFTGFQYLKEAVATFYKREYDVTLDPTEEVAILFGGKTGLVEVCECFLDEGDLALVPDPGYPDYLSGVALAGASMHRMPLKHENDYLPDYRAISNETFEKAKLMLLNYPNNPTAGIATPKFFEETVALAEQHDVCVVHDFAYGAIGFDGEKPISFLQTEGSKNVGVEIYTMSKTYNMAGWRIAFAVGNRSVVHAIETFQNHYYCSIFGAIQEAAAAALTGPQDVVQQCVELYEERRDVLVQELHRIGCPIHPSKGSFFAWMPVPEGFTSEGFATELMEKCSVIVAPGNGFGEAGEGFVRIGLLESTERIKEAVNRIAQLNVYGNKVSSN